MGKRGLIISDINTGKEVKDLVDAYLIPLKDFSINYPSVFSLEDIIEIKKTNKEVYIFINKNIHEKEITKLKEILLEIEKIKINGIIFYDIALVELKKELNLKTELIWNQEHLANSYGTVNYWYDKGVKSSYLSSELTKREIEEIRENTKAKLFVNVFGYIPMFTSRRHLVDNYQSTFSIKEKGNKIYKEGKTYNIFDTKHGTTVYSNYILNIKENINADYLIYNSNLIPNIKDILKDNNMKEENGFLYQETIYKVK
ncbi:MAG: U32 family peptidase [Bacilli bacterium]|nr:U32 family peptidase [Bacilli bacterium]